MRQRLLLWRTGTGPGGGATVPDPLGGVTAPDPLGGAQGLMVGGVLVAPVDGFRGIGHMREVTVVGLMEVVAVVTKSDRGTPLAEDP